MWKKSLYIGMTALLVFLLAACGAKSDSNASAAQQVNKNHYRH